MLGWTWSERVKSVVKADSGEVAHIGHVLSGSQIVRIDAGTELAIGSGDVFSIPPGQDAWTAADEPCVRVDFAGLADCGKR